MAQTIRRALCVDCAGTLRDAQLVFRKIPGTDGEEPKCAWCRQRRYTSTYEIRYGRGREKDSHSGARTGSE